VSLLSTRQTRNPVAKPMTHAAPSATQRKCETQKEAGRRTRVARGPRAGAGIGDWLSPALGSSGPSTLSGRELLSPRVASGPSPADCSLSNRSAYLLGNSAISVRSGVVPIDWNPSQRPDNDDPVPGNDSDGGGRPEEREFNLIASPHRDRGS